MLLSTSGVRMLIRSAPGLRHRLLAARVDQDALEHRAHRSDGDVLGDRPERKDAVRLAVARDERDGLLDGRVAALALRGVEEPAEHLGLALAGQSGEPDDFAAIGGELAAVGLRGRTRARARRAGLPLRADSGSRFGGGALDDASHRRDQRVAIEPGGRALGHDLAVAHHDDAVGGGKNLAEEMRDQDAGAAARDEAADEGEKLTGDMRVERGGRLVEDHQRERRIGDRKGARDLHHLAAADRKIADDLAGRDAVLRERSRRACRGSAGRSVSASRCLCSPAWKTWAFSATVRLGQSESSWNTQRMPWRWAPTTS